MHACVQICIPGESCVQICMPVCRCVRLCEVHVRVCGVLCEHRCGLWELLSIGSGSSSVCCLGVCEACLCVDDAYTCLYVTVLPRNFSVRPLSSSTPAPFYSSYLFVPWFRRVEVARALREDLLPWPPSVALGPPWTRVQQRV